MKLVTLNRADNDEVKLFMFHFYNYLKEVILEGFNSSEEEIKEIIMNNEDANLELLVVDNDFVGLVIYQDKSIDLEGYGFITEFYITESNRGKGLGKAMYTLLKSKLEDAKLCAYPIPGKEEFWKSLGFKYHSKNEDNKRDIYIDGE